MTNEHPFKVIEGGKQAGPEIESYDYESLEQNPPSQEDIENKMLDIFRDSFGSGKLETKTVNYAKGPDKKVIYLMAEAINVNGWDRICLRYNLRGGHEKGVEVFDKTIISVDFYSNDSKLPVSNMSKDLAKYNDGRWHELKKAI